tara:strand:+ start:168 stop:518 length:351 start_codon:yes stop_codon:yes gene_type:complete
MNYKELNGRSIREGFNEFNRENPHIYNAFEEQAFKAIKKGRLKISSKLIINWIRWNEFLTSSDKNFKINDAYQSYYARCFVEKNPEYFTFFNFRKLRNEDDGNYMSKDDNGKIIFM